MLKILLVTGNYVPGKNGGIENYTHWLATLLLENKFKVQVAALHVDELANYTYEGINVNYMQGRFSNFEILLEQQQFDICHFHEYSAFGGIEMHWILKAKQQCKKVFFTFHLPYLTCYKNDFRYMDAVDCNLFTDTNRCVRCVLAHKIGFNKKFKKSWILDCITGLSQIAGLNKRLEKKIIENNNKLNDLTAACDKIFIYANWFIHILRNNGYHSLNIRKIPYKTKSEVSIAKAVDHSIKYKVLFVGRIQYQKGLHLLCRSMNQVVQKNITLDVYGNIVDKNYFDDCVNEFAFNFKGTTNYFHLLNELKKYDFLILPSVFTEMFSLIIKDAFYEQLPVIASAAKGNKDAVKDGVNGFLFEYDNAIDLAKTIDKAYHLKLNGWEPQFENTGNPETDINEILSYYSL